MDDFDVAPGGQARTPDGITPPPPGIEVAPLDIDGVRTVGVGTLLWGLAFVALLPFYPSLQRSGHLWWLWTCAAGLGLGLLGLEYCRRRRDRALETGESTTEVLVVPVRTPPVPYVPPTSETPAAPESPYALPPTPYAAPTPELPAAPENPYALPPMPAPTPTPPPPAPTPAEGTPPQVAPRGRAGRGRSSGRSGGGRRKAR